MTRDEKYVKDHWKEINEHWKDNDSYAPDLFIVNIGDGHFYDKDPNKVWKKAAEFTKDTEEELETLNYATNLVEGMNNKFSSHTDIATSLYIISLLAKRKKKLEVGSLK